MEVSMFDVNFNFDLNFNWNPNVNLNSNWTFKVNLLTSRRSSDCPWILVAWIWVLILRLRFNANVISNFDLHLNFHNSHLNSNVIFGNWCRSNWHWTEYPLILRSPSTILEPHDFCKASCLDLSTLDYCWTSLWCILDVLQALRNFVFLLEWHCVELKSGAF